MCVCVFMEWNGNVALGKEGKLAIGVIVVASLSIPPFPESDGGDGRIQEVENRQQG